MSEEPKKWKLGDIGPDGRVFWAYIKTCKGGEYWVSPDKFLGLMEKTRIRARKARINRIDHYREKNRRNTAKRREEDPESFKNRNRKSYANNVEARRAKSKQWRKRNLAKAKYNESLKSLKRTFSMYCGSSYEEFILSLRYPGKVAKNIANLTPDPGQTLAELIHELSGYAMDVCEQIANPPAPAEPAPEVEHETEPIIPGPDLF